MLDRIILRRTVTLSALFLLFAVSTALLPLLMLIGAVVDAFRSLSSGRPWVTVRMLAFGWIYLLGEIWAVVSLGAVALLGRERSISATYRLQRRWARWNFVAVSSVFGLRFEVEGREEAGPGPILLLARHASLIDTLIPAEFVSRTHEIRLRYVLKKELLVDPALDIAGNRLPNCFIGRGAGESDRDRMAISELAETLGKDEGILIYPEGTRFSVEKADRLRRRFAGRDGGVAVAAAELANVLPPRPGGTLALMEASDADVVVLAHEGLEGFARVRDMWSGDLVGSTIRVRFRRTDRSEIPIDRTDRVGWLFSVWSDVDDWIANQKSV